MSVGDVLPARGGLRSRIAEIKRNPLLRDGYALALNSGVTAIVGLVYWTVAARVYSPRIVGINSALISAMMFLAGIATLNLSNILVRFLREAGSGARRLVLGSYGLTALVAVAGALFFVACGWLPDLHGETAALVLAFVAACTIWTVFVLQDGALTGIGRAVWVPVENGAFAVAKLGLLIAFAGFAADYGIFASWTLSVAITVVVVNLLLFGRVLRRRDIATTAPGDLAYNRGFLNYVATDWVCAAFWLAATMLLPVIVTASAGAVANASFALAWAVAYPLYMVAASIGSALVVHGAADVDGLSAAVRRTARQGLIILVPAVALLVAAAPLALEMFGRRYADEAAGLLRLLTLGALPNFVLVLWVSEARARRRLGGAVLALGVQSIVTLVLLVPFLDAYGVIGAGYDWLGVQCVVAIGVLAAFWLRNRPHPAVARSARAAVGDVPRTACRTDSSSAVVLAQPPGGPAVIVKVALTPVALRRMEAHRSAVDRLRSHPDLQELAAILPRIESAGDGWLVECALPGTDGRRLPAPAVVQATAAAIAPLYGATARDDATSGLAAWLAPRRAAALALGGDAAGRLADTLDADLDGRALRWTWVHGDLWPGNVLLSQELQVTGIVDWEAAQPDGLAVVDIAFLVLCGRQQASGRTLGSVARRLIDGRDELTGAERALLDAVCPPGETIATADAVRMAWLDHIALRSSQVTPRPYGLWTRHTIRPVLR
jgi:O-antigen/teichoic acid export membrane protein